MRISIIVPTLNEAGCIAGTLEALRQLEGDREIIVVDGGSCDDTSTLAQAFGVKVVTAERGRGMQLHAGTLSAGGDVLWFVHADTVPPLHALADIERSLEDPCVGGGNFGLLFDGPSRAARQLTAIYPVLSMLGLCYGDSGIFVRRSTYDAVGGFRPLALFEDLDLLKRLRKKGRFVHLPSQIRTSSRRFEKRNFAVVWLHWTTLQILYWCGVSPNRLARWYDHARS